MDILIKPKKNRYIIYAIIIAIFSTVGMNISLMNTNADKLLKKFEYSSTWNNFMAVFRTSISGKNDVRLFYQLVAVGITLMFLIIFSYRFCVREIVSSAVVSIIFGFCMWFGTVFSNKESWNYFLRNKYVKILDIWYILAYTLLMFGALLIIGKIVAASGNKAEQKAEVKTKAKTKDKTVRNTRKVFFMCAAVLLVCWLPYYIVFWPGFQHTDLPTQMLQYFHVPTRFQGHDITDGVNILYSNDHPYFQTKLVGLCIEFGFKIHNVNVGYSIYTFIKMIAFIVAFSSIIATLYRFEVNHTLLKISLVLYAVIPVFPLYSLLIGGDSFFSVFFLYYMLEILWIFGTKGAVLKNNKFILAMILEIFLMSASKNQGVYVAAAMFLFCIIYFSKYRARIAVCMVVPIILFQFGYCGAFFKVAKIASVGKQEALSVCFQQTARYVKYHGDEVTQEEEEAIKKVLNYKDIGNLYDPNLSDPVKKTFKTESTSEDLKNYFKVWLSMGLKHPGEYIQSFIANTYQYYYMEFRNKRGLYLKPEIMDFYIRKRPWVQKSEAIQKLIRKLQVHVPEKLKSVREKGVLAMDTVRRFPVVSWFTNPGVITWMMLIGFFALWTKRRYTSILEFLPVFLIFGVCPLSPKNGNLRYLYPACCMVPALLAAAFGNLREEQANAIEDTKEVSKRRRAGSRKKHRIARTLPEDKRQRVKV